MAKKKVDKPDGFFKIYYKIMIALLILGLPASIYSLIGSDSFGTIFGIYSAIVGFVGVIVIVLSVVAWVKFVKAKLPKKTLVVPIFYLANFIVLLIMMFIMALFAGIKAGLAGSEVVDFSVPIGIYVWDILASLFMLGYSIHILKEFKR